MNAQSAKSLSTDVILDLKEVGTIFVDINVEVYSIAVKIAHNGKMDIILMSMDISI